MKKNYLSEEKIVSILKRYSAFIIKRNSMLESGKPRFIVDEELKNEINKLYDDTKEFEFLEIDTQSNIKEWFYLAYLDIRSIKNKYQFYKIGLIDENGQKVIEPEDGKIKYDYNLKDEIDKLIKKYLKLYDYCEHPYIENFVYGDAKNGINMCYRKIMQDLADLFLFINDIDNALFYYKEAVQKYKSKEALYMLINIYTMLDEYEDIDSAERYFKQLDVLPFDDSINVGVNQKYKYLSGIILCKYYYNSGDYEKALIKAEYSYSKSKEYQLNRNFNDDYEGQSLKYINDVKNKIANLSNSSVNDDLLKDYFSEKTISLMSTDIKVYIQTTMDVYEYFLKASEKNITLDYSSVIIPIQKGLEAILYKIFGDRFFNFIKNKCESNIDFNKINYTFIYTEEITGNNGNKIKVKHLKENIEKIEYGTAIHIACNVDKYSEPVTYIPNDYFVEFCSDICGIQNAGNVIIDFAKKLEEIRLIRNKTCHRFRVDKEDAESCREKLYTVTKFIEEIYTNFHIIFEQQ